MAELFRDVVDDAVIGGRGGRENRYAWIQRPEDPTDPAIVRPKVVPPVGDAVRLIDDEEADGTLDPRQEVGHERLIRETLRGDQEDVDLVALQALPNGGPVGHVGGVDRRGGEAQPPRHRDLVAHQREQWTDDQGRAMACIPSHAGRDPVDRALAPAGPLNDERATSIIDDRPDRFALPITECGTWTEHRVEMPVDVVGR